MNKPRTTVTKADTLALAEHIRRTREQLGLSQGQFARKLGVSQQKVSEWENGQRLRAVVQAWRLAELVAKVQAANGR
jgi:DNA-binding transcriptional regulator YiaG